MFRNWQDKHASNSEPQQATGDSQITLDLPWPPTANRYWRNVNGRMVLSRAGREYREAVDGLWWKFLQEGGGCRQVSEDDKLWIYIEAYPPDKRRRDLDNIIKPIFDALQFAGAFADDSQIVTLTVLKLSPVPGGMVRLSLGRCRCWRARHPYDD